MFCFPGVELGWGGVGWGGEIYIYIYIYETYVSGYVFDCILSASQQNQTTHCRECYFADITIEVIFMVRSSAI